MKIKVALGLSGGVDSAVSAYLLKEKGFDVSCIYLNCFDSDIPGCRGDNDRKDALAVAMHLGLPFQVLDFRKEYQAAVIDYFKKEYLLGRTPNPDVICNRDIKFGLFLDWAIKAGFDYVATGHYADGPGFSERKIVGTPAPRKLDTSEREAGSLRLKQEFYWGATPLLRIPKDLHKDQTYFLWAVPRQKFSRVLFPLGNLLKSEVREIAKDAGLGVADKKDSTGICFVGEVRVEDFLKRLGVKEKEGEVVIRSVIGSPLSVIGSRLIGNQSVGSEPMNRKPTNHKQKTENRKPITEYKVVGSHRGVWFYTIGQRHGWEMTNDKYIQMTNGQKDRPPLYVIEKDIKKNRLIVGFGAETYRDQFTVSQVNWLAELPITNYQLPIAVRIRHGGELIPCSLEAKVNSKQGTVNSKQTIVNSNDRLPVTNYHLPFTVYLCSPQRGIAAGQSAVFYSKNGIVLGGGVIQ